MKITKTVVDKAVAVVAAASSPALSLCIIEHALTPDAAVAVGGIVAAAVAAYHGGGAVAGKMAAPAVSDRTP